MSASELLAGLRECGVELVVTGDQLRYRPKEAVTSLLLDQIREYKPGLLQLLKSEQGKRQEATKFLDDHSSPEGRKPKAAGWKPMERCGKTIWQSPQNGFWYSQEMALRLSESGDASA